MGLMKTLLTRFKLQTKCVGNKQEKTTDANQYVILLRRIILGKATSQDYKLESQDRDDTFKKPFKMYNRDRIKEDKSKF